MPCSKQMRGCHIGCLHRRSVEEYRLARHAAQLQRDDITLGWPSDERLANAQLGPVTPDFRQWLIGSAEARDYEYDPGEDLAA